MLGVIGPNGAGKTTLFNVISGVVRPTEGACSLDGRDVTREPVHRRAAAGLGRTFQTSSLFPALSVLENVRLAAQAHAGPRGIRVPHPAAHGCGDRAARGRARGGRPRRTAPTPTQPGSPTARSASSRSPCSSPWSPR